MSILLSIGAILGKVLLVLLTIVVLLILLLLFAPFSYCGRIVKEGEDFSVRGHVRWLFRVFQVQAEVEKGTAPHWDIRLCGVSLLPLLKRNTARKQEKTDRKAASEERVVRKQATIRPSIEPGEKRNTESTVTVVTSRRPTLMEKLAARIQAWIGKGKRFVRKAIRLFRRAYAWSEYLQSPSFQRAKEVLWKEGLAILRHVLPRKMQGDVCFGFDDPAKTGQAMALLALLYPVVPQRLSIEPDFLESHLEADVDVRGHIIVAVPAIHALRLWLHKDVRRFIRRLQKTEKTKETRKETWQKTESIPNFRTM